MKWFNKLHPVAQTAIVALGVVIAWQYLRTTAQKIPGVGKYL